MKMKALTLLFFPAAALAADFFHPATDEVVVAGPDPITICFDYRGTCAVQDCGGWICDQVEGLGAREPIYYVLGPETHVKVMGARWAYAWGVDGWAPMSRD